MIKYAKVIDEETKICEIGSGDPEAIFYEENIQDGENEKIIVHKVKEFYKSIGMTEMEVEQAYDGNWYLAGYAPKKPLNEIKAEKRAEINGDRDKARKTEGAEYDGDLFDIDEVSQSNILAQIKVAEIIGDPKATYNYRSKTNTDHLLTLAQLQELGLAIAVKVNAIYVKSWDLKAQVDKATTAEEVEAIKWTSA